MNTPKTQCPRLLFDIRDIDPGEPYFAITSKEKGGRLILNGCFPAAWRSKQEARAFAAGNPDFTVVRCLKPELPDGRLTTENRASCAVKSGSSGQKEIA